MPARWFFPRLGLGGSSPPALRNIPRLNTRVVGTTSHPALRVVRAVLVLSVGPDRVNEEASVAVLDLEGTAGERVDGRIRQDGAVKRGDRRRPGSRLATLALCGQQDGMAREGRSGNAKTRHSLSIWPE